jgi:hypothetical protein
VLDEHLVAPSVRVVEGGSRRFARPRVKLGQERHAALQPDVLGHGTVSGGGRGDHEGRFRSLPGTGALPEPLCGAGRGDGQPLKAHKGEKVRELIEERGCELLYLPPYSPDLNLIEQAFSKMKALMRKRGARTQETLIGAMGAALSAITARDASGFFGHCGYRVLAQLL